MAFKLDIGQFFAGGADVIVQKVKAEEAQARSDESWDRRHQKTQDAIDEKTRGQERRAKEKEAEQLAESLALHYTADQVTDIMSKGIVAGKYAVTYAQGLDAQGLDASTAYTMPKSIVQSKYAFDVNDPRGSQQSPEAAKAETTKVIADITEAESQPFSTRFSKPTKKKQSKATTYQARLLELELQMSNAEGSEQLAALQSTWDTTYENYIQYSNTKDDDGNKPLYDWSKQTREKLIQTRMNAIFKGADFVESNLAEDRINILTGNDGNNFILQNQAVNSLSTDYAEVIKTDAIFNNLVKTEKKNLKFKIEGFKTQRNNNWQSSVDRLDNGEPANYDPVRLGKAVHYPHNPSKPVAKEDIVKNNYSNNSTVQYITKNSEGIDVIRMAIITNYGVIY